MNTILANMFKTKRKRPAFLTMLLCLECGHLFESSRTGCPCPRCADKATIPAANWAPAKYGMPKLENKGEMKNG
ncbi:MAG: hypothetical protein KKF12_18520 [Proteobacteria bacterium]|nr:hypothetical protein [Desulfobacula sp.]MBU3952965.1 hypothetical protein [Pseudomonadota bacterium]MBU4132816.1 hypothetical protein [Pseudomonadota bacterium]